MKNENTYEKREERAVKKIQKCPICEKGFLRKGTIKEEMFGVYLGEFPAEICNICKESFTDAETTRKIEEIAKEKGIWGLGAKTKITKTGNSLAIRIPSKLVGFLKLKEGEEVYLQPEAGKLTIEKECTNGKV